MVASCTAKCCNCVKSHSFRSFANQSRAARIVRKSRLPCRNRRSHSFRLSPSNSSSHLLTFCSVRRASHARMPTKSEQEKPLAIYLPCLVLLSFALNRTATDFASNFSRSVYNSREKREKGEREEETIKASGVVVSASLYERVDFRQVPSKWMAAEKVCASVNFFSRRKEKEF